MKTASIIVFFLILTGAGLAQRPDKTAAVRAFEAGDYSTAAELSKRLTKSNKDDAEAWQILGASYIKLKRYTDSIKAYERSAALAPTNDDFLAQLSFVYLTVRDIRADPTARRALELNQQNAEAHYVLGVLSNRTKNYASAYDRAKRAIQLRPEMPAAYRLKSQALVGSFAALNSIVMEPTARGDLLNEAAAELEKYIGLLPPAAVSVDLRSELEALRWFSAYYSLPEHRIRKDISMVEPPEPDTTPIKILKKLPPAYTENARMRGVQGTIVLLVAFDSSGKIGPILVTKSLDEDLDQQALTVAKKIEFTSPTRHGVPYTVVKQIEYTFSIY